MAFFFGEKHPKWPIRHTPANLNGTHIGLNISEPIVVSQQRLFVLPLTAPLYYLTIYNITSFSKYTFKRESTKHGPLVHGPPLWTRSMDQVHQNMDRVHGPPIFTSWGYTINYNLMTFDDMLCDGSSFGKPWTTLIAHLPWKFMFHKLIFTFTGNFKAYRLILESIIVLHLVFSVSWQHKYQHSRADLSMVYCKQTPRDWQLIWIFSLMNK